VINDGQGDNLNECTTYGDGSFNWGTVSMATVQVGGETASQVPGGTANAGIPIQLITTDTVPTAVQASGQCVPSATTPDEDTPALFGANGVIGIGVQPQDCVLGGTNQCTSASTSDPYWLCTTAGACSQAGVPVTDQVWNPVAAFSSTDINGEMLTLQSIPAAGQATATGTLTFGINTQSNNQMPNTATIYELDQYGYLGSLVFGGVTYTSSNSYGSFLDAGSNGLYISDGTTLTSALGTSVTDCSVSGTDIGYYCPSSTVSIPVTLGGTNSTSGSYTLSVANALNLFSANSSFAAFNDLAGESGGTDPSTDAWDLGLPFFFGKTIFFGIGGTTVSGQTSTNGYYAF